MIEKVEDGALVPEIGRRGYVVSLAGVGPGSRPSTEGCKIDVLTAADLGAVGFTSRRGSGGADAGLEAPPGTAGRAAARAAPSPRLPGQRASSRPADSLPRRAGRASPTAAAAAR